MGLKAGERMKGDKMDANKMGCVTEFCCIEKQGSDEALVMKVVWGCP